MSISHKLLSAYGETEKAGTGEVLRILRDSVEAEILWYQTGGFVGISAQKVLLAYLCKLQERYADEARLQLEGKEAFENVLRSMWGHYEPYGASYRSEQGKQLTAEHPDSLQALSRLLARHSEKAWMEYRRSDAAPRMGWEDGYARVANGIPARVDRLRALGNAVSPYQALPIFAAIREAVT